MSTEVTEWWDPEEDLARIQRAVQVELEAIAADLEEDAQERIQEADARATDDLLNSISGTVSRRGSMWILTFRAGTTYAPFVEWSTRPHWAPIRPLARWARAKFGASGEEKWDIAYGAQWSIAQTGTTGIGFMTDALREQGVELLPPGALPVLNAVRIVRPTIQRRLERRIDRMLD